MISANAWVHMCHEAMVTILSKLISPYNATVQNLFVVEGAVVSTIDALTVQVTLATSPLTRPRLRRRGRVRGVAQASVRDR